MTPFIAGPTTVMEAIIGLAIIIITAVAYNKQKKKEKLDKVNKDPQSQVALSAMAELADNDNEKDSGDLMGHSSSSSRRDMKF